MKPILLALAFIGGLLIASAGIGATSPAKHLAAVAREADSVVIEFYTSAGREEVAFADKPWLERLAGILERSSYVPQSHCLCISYPQIRLYRNKELTGTLSVHHGTKLRAYAGSVSGDFTVGAQVGQEIAGLAKERKPD